MVEKIIQERGVEGRRGGLQFRAALVRKAAASLDCREGMTVWTDGSKQITLSGRRDDSRLLCKGPGAWGFVVHVQS